jgi:hypothetical protein
MLSNPDMSASAKLGPHLFLAIAFSRGFIIGFLVSLLMYSLHFRLLACDAS